MRKWLPWMILPVILASMVVFNHASNPALLQDTDTRILLEAIRERSAPLSWFTGDWPLENHFYRPFSTLVFELDHALHGDNAAGYGLTNSVLAALCIVLLFWFTRELTDSPALAATASSLFGVQHLNGPVLNWTSGVCWLLAGLVWIRLLWPGRNVWQIAFASVILVLCAWMITGPINFSGRIVDWLPGRTASTMTVFALIAMAAYARYERLTSSQTERPPVRALDLPATKGTVVQQAGSHSYWWVVIALVATLLALGSYEQAVMLPALLTCIAVLTVARKRKPKWIVVISSWVLLGGYLLLRSSLVASEVSQYQSQQFRSGPGVYHSILEYVAPLYSWILTFYHSLATGVAILLFGASWIPLILSGGNVASYFAIWKSRKRWLALALLSMAFLSYLPMAWLKFFGHYTYWPGAIWSAFTVCFLVIAGEQFIRAVSPREIQAPERQRPAPGSLPHP